MTQEPKLPLCEGIVGEMKAALMPKSQDDFVAGFNRGVMLGAAVAESRFAALSVEEVARVLANARGHGMLEKESAAAQAVMQLLRKE